jgi:hypothetical protein
MITSLASISLVGAQTAPYGFVYTTTAANVPSINFLVGQEVHINWAVGSSSTVNIQVTYQSLTGAVVPLANWETGIGVPQSSFNGQIFFVPTQAGTYYVHLLGSAGGATTYEITTASVFVAPESVFGALSAIGAGVAAFGTVAIIKKRKSSFLPL